MITNEEMKKAERLRDMFLSMSPESQQQIGWYATALVDRDNMDKMREPKTA